MSLQSDFELCLEYAKALESKQNRRVQAQNNIIFVQNQSEQLKSKRRTCKILTALSAIALTLFVFMMICIGGSEALNLIPALIIPCVVLAVSLSVGFKSKKESKELELKKTSIIQRYTEEVEESESEIIALIKEIGEKDLFDIVPEDYFYTDAIEFCLAQVRKKLASSASEAFLQLDAEIKRLEQMEYLEQMNNAQQEQLNEIKRAIDINTFITLSKQDNSRY